MKRSANAAEFIDKWIHDTTSDVELTHLLECGPGRVFRSDPRFADGVPSGVEGGELRHVEDWIRASLERGEEWIKRCDDKGRPLKLMKCGTLERLAHEADKAMRRWNSQITDASREGDELAFEFSDGYRLYKLNDAASLDFESRAMGHCVGNGAYDAAVSTGDLTIYSLRDQAGKSHATIEVSHREGRNKITQIMGKANTRLKTEYMKRLVEWFNADRTLALTEVELPSGFEFDRTMKIIDLKTLKPGDQFDGDLVLRTYEDREQYTPPIPEGLVVLGDLTVQAHRRQDRSAYGDQPYDFQKPVGSRQWDGSETHGPVLKMPADVVVQGVMTVHGFQAAIEAQAFSYHFVACRVDELPKVVERTLVMTECHMPTPFDEIKFSRNLLLDSSGTVQFDGGVTVGGQLTIVRTRSINSCQTEMYIDGTCSVLGNLEMKDCVLNAGSHVKIDGSVSINWGTFSFAGNLEVGGDFKIYDASMDRMPDNLTVGGNIDMDWADIDRWPAEMSAVGETKIGGGVSVRSGTAPVRFGQP